MAVAWNTKENRCWQKGLNVFSQGPLSADDTIMAFADRTIFEDRSDACGYTNQTVTEDINKRQYQMLCGVRWKGDNYDPDIRDSYPAKHTETLEECLEYCDEGTPICYGVLYSPNLGIGYRNCGSPFSAGRLASALDYVMLMLTIHRLGEERQQYHRAFDDLHARRERCNSSCSAHSQQYVREQRRGDRQRRDIQGVL